MSERVLRWIAAEVDAGREVSESSVVEGCEVSLGQARTALGGDWARFRVMDCGHELGQWDRQARACGGCREGNTSAAIAPGERAVSAAEFAAIVGLPAEVHHELRPAVAPAVLSRPMGRPLAPPRDLREVRARPERPRCDRCGGRLAMEVDEVGVRTESCFACGPQYGRRPATPEDEASMYPEGVTRSRHRGASHGGARL